VPFSFALKTDDDCFVDLENILQVSKFYQLQFVGRQRSRVYKRASQTVAIMYAENRRILGSGHYLWREVAPKRKGLGKQNFE
jgi:hypothetical protein